MANFQCDDLQVDGKHVETDSEVVSANANISKYLTIVPIAALSGPITLTLPDSPAEGSRLWIKAVGNAGDQNISLAAQGDNDLEEAGLSVLDTQGAAREMYYTEKVSGYEDGLWMFLTYM